MWAMTAEAEGGPGCRSPCTRTHPGSPARSQRSNERCQPPVLIAAKESVGRHLQVQVVPTKMSQKQKWLKACITDFNVATGQHKVKYMERGNREDEWLLLDRTQFGWLSDPGSWPNPTYHPTLTPQTEDALDHAVMVFWPGMSKWYKGKVRSYNAATRQHVVCFHDGYIRDYDLRHEAIMWLEVPGLATREDLSHWQRLADLLPHQHGSPDDAWQASARPGRSAPSRKMASSRKLRVTEAMPDSPSSRAQAQAALAMPASAQPSEARRGDALHPLIVIKGADGVGPEACQPASGPAAARIREGETGSSCSQAEEPAEPARRANSGCGFMADTFPCTQQQQQHTCTHAPYEEALAWGACSADAARVTCSPAAGGEADASSSARCSGGGTTHPAVGDTGTQRPSSAASSGQNRAAPESQAGEDGVAWHGMAVQPGLQRIRVRAPGARAGRGRGSSAPRRHPGSALELSSMHWRGDSSASGSPSPIGRAGEAAVGARIAIWWPADEAYYRGKVTSYDSYHKRSKVRYDDEEEEWLALPRQRFSCMLPRARSAGCNAQLMAAMQSLGATNYGPAVQANGPGRGAAELVKDHAGAGKQQELVGWRVGLMCPGTSKVSEGEVLGWDAETGRHLVLYDDGEHECMVLDQECISLHPPQRGMAAQTAPGLPQGECVPKGKLAVGWRVGVYWKDDQKFYTGEVESYETATGRHIVLYDDGEREPISLTKEKVKWVLPPGVHGSEEAVSGSEGEQDERARSRAVRRSTSLRGGRKHAASPRPDDVRPPKAARLEVDDTLPAWRTPCNPHAAMLPVMVRDLGTTRELHSRRGHRLTLRSMRIFLPHMLGLMHTPAVRVVQPTKASETAQAGVARQQRVASAGAPLEAAGLAIHEHQPRPGSQAIEALQNDISELRETSLAAQCLCKVASPLLCTAAAAASAPYSMIPPSNWHAPIPALSQLPASLSIPVEGRAPTGGCLDRCLPCLAASAPSRDLIASASQPAHNSNSSSCSASGSPLASPRGFLGLFCLSSQRAAPAEGNTCSAPPLLADSASLPKDSLQRHASCPACSQQQLGELQHLQLLQPLSDVRSSSSLPMPGTPAAAEDVRCRLMHHSSSISQADLQRPGSAGSDDGALPGGLASVLQPPGHMNGKRSPVIPEAVQAHEQEAHKHTKFGGVLAIPGPGFDALGKWAAGAASSGAAIECIQSGLQGQHSLSKGCPDQPGKEPANGHMQLRYSATESDPDMASLPHSVKNNQGNCLVNCDDIH